MSIIDFINWLGYWKGEGLLVFMLQSALVYFLCTSCSLFWHFNLLKFCLSKKWRKNSSLYPSQQERSLKFKEHSKINNKLELMECYHNLLDRPFSFAFKIYFGVSLGEEIGKGLLHVTIHKKGGNQHYLKFKEAPPYHHVALMFSFRMKLLL